MSRQAKSHFIIRARDGSYFDRMTAIGPAFGATREQAHRFDSREELVRATVHWAFADTIVEEVLAVAAGRRTSRW